jgi:hypothetical protein
MPPRSLRWRLFKKVHRPIVRPQCEHSLETTGQTKTDFEPEIRLYRFSDGPMQSWKVGSQAIEHSRETRSRW